MKILLILQLYLLHSTSALSVRSQLPSFSWLNGTDPLLKIRFPDGGHDVIRFLKTKRLQGEDDDCIMSGEFEQEPDVSVTLTGGCVNSKDFEMTIVGSERLQHATFEITNGKAKPTGHPTNRGFDESDDVVGFPRPSFRNQESKPTSRDLNTKLGLIIEPHADLDFWNTYPGGAMCRIVIEKILAHTQAWFIRPGLKPKIILEPEFTDIWRYKRSMTTDLVLELDKASKYVDARRSAFAPEGEFYALQDRVAVFFGIQNASHYRSGIANFRSVCREEVRNNVTAIVKHWRHFSKTGEVLAHELAHTLHVGHDMDDKTKLYRQDKSGKSCFCKGSLMSYQAERYTWSICSMESLQNAFSKGWLNCLPKKS